MKIDFIRGRQVLDSRGNPTVEVEVGCNGVFASAISPSGASTGKYEAYELRDHGKFYHGRSVLNAVENVNKTIANAIKGANFLDQNHIDRLLIDLDGTDNKSNLGANVILPTSLAIAKLAAKVNKVPLYKYINELLDIQSIKPLMPMPFVNIINGGVHADNPIDIQEFMIVPIGYELFTDRIRVCCEIFHELKKLLKLAKHSVNVGDEGGFAPNLQNTDEAIEFIIRAIESAGYKPHVEVALALDVAASSFWNGGQYKLDGRLISSNSMVDFLKSLVERYKIISIEDSLSEEDYDGWKLITEKLGNKVQLIGDDLFVTNKKLLESGVENEYGNSILIKPNQIGTLSETLDTIRCAYQNNYRYMISHRSGESEDTIIAHIAVGTGAGQIKTGSVCRGERTAKYNELIRIEESLNLC